jgi:hypothetical protein
MTEHTLTCDELDALLPDYLEGAVDDDTRVRIEEHAASCERCGTLLEDLTMIRYKARALPDLVPSRDLWDGIAARIEAPVVSLPGPDARPARRAAAPWPRRRTTAWLGAAAAALVAATAGVTYVATTHWGPRPTQVAARPDTVGRGERGAVVAPPPAQSTATPTVTPASEDSGLRRGTPAPSRATSVRAVKNQSVEQVYDREIALLNAIVRDRRSQLDTATVAVIQRNLQIIDMAIAQCHAALAKDPKSRFLNDQLNNALDQKVELLRTVALLPTRT